MFSMFSSKVALLFFARCLSPAILLSCVLFVSFSIFPCLPFFSCSSCFYLFQHFSLIFVMFLHFAFFQFFMFFHFFMSSTLCLFFFSFVASAPVWEETPPLRAPKIEFPQKLKIKQEVVLFLTPFSLSSLFNFRRFLVCILHVSFFFAIFDTSLFFYVIHVFFVLVPFLFFLPSSLMPCIINSLSWRKSVGHNCG